MFGGVTCMPNRLEERAAIASVAQGDTWKTAKQYITTAAIYFSALDLAIEVPGQGVRVLANSQLEFHTSQAARTCPIR